MRNADNIESMLSEYFFKYDVLEHRIVYDNSLALSSLTFSLPETLPECEGTTVKKSPSLYSEGAL